MDNAGFQLGSRAGLGSVLYDDAHRCGVYLRMGVHPSSDERNTDADVTPEGSSAASVVTGTQQCQCRAGAFDRLPHRQQQPPAQSAFQANASG